jgi:hypothetical protein
MVAQRTTLRKEKNVRTAVDMAATAILKGSLGGLREDGLIRFQPAQAFV